MLNILPKTLHVVVVFEKKVKENHIRYIVQYNVKIFEILTIDLHCGIEQQGINQISTLFYN